MGIMLSNLVIYSHIYKINLCWNSKVDKDLDEHQDNDFEKDNLIEKKIRKRKINKKKQNNNFNKNS